MNAGQLNKCKADAAGCLMGSSDKLLWVDRHVKLRLLSDPHDFNK